MEQSNRPDTRPIVDEQERAADSPLAARIRHARYLGAVRETALPDGSWDLLFVRKAGGPWTVIQTGQIAAPVEVNSDAGDEMLTIALRPEVYMPRLPGRLTLNRGVLRPVERDRQFWVEGERFEIPDFENAEQLVADLARKGLLERDPVVALALRGARQRLDERSVQRHFAEVTGLGLKAFRQIERAHEAARLLRAGQSPSQVAAALGFTDQAHLTHSLKRLLGQTPGRLAGRTQGVAPEARLTAGREALARSREPD
jgi:AraC-like DNA-binding protein